MLGKKIKTNCQLIATCFFCKTTGEIKFENYERYYKKETKNTIGDIH